MKLNEKAFGLSAGILGALCGLLNMTSWGGGMMRYGMMGGYGGGFGLVGILYAFLIAAAAGFAFAWVYNQIAKS